MPSPPLVARRRLAETFGVASLDAFGSFSDAEAIAAVMAVDYVRATQAGTLPRLAHPTPCGSVGLLSMDAATRASLEIHRARVLQKMEAESIAELVRMMLDLGSPVT